MVVWVVNLPPGGGGADIMIFGRNPGTCFNSEISGRLASGGRGGHQPWSCVDRRTPYTAKCTYNTPTTSQCHNVFTRLCCIASGQIDEMHDPCNGGFFFFFSVPDNADVFICDPTSARTSLYRATRTQITRNNKLLGSILFQRALVYEVKIIIIFDRTETAGL